MIYLKLFWDFFRVSCFTFGGAYGAIPLIRDMVLRNGWLSEELLSNMIAVSESTPGPIMVNLATYIGSSQAGFWGSLVATTAMVCLLVPFFVTGITVLLIGLTRFYRIISMPIRYLWNMSMSSFTVGMALLGVFKIAGVPNSIFLVPIWIGGGVTALISIVLLIVNISKKTEEK